MNPTRLMTVYKAENNDADDAFLRELIHPKLTIQLLLRFKHVHE
jgi:hypothetical protein